MCLISRKKGKTEFSSRMRLHRDVDGDHVLGDTGFYRLIIDPSSPVSGITHLKCGLDWPWYASCTSRLQKVRETRVRFCPEGFGEFALAGQSPPGRPMHRHLVTEVAESFGYCNATIATWIRSRSGHSPLPTPCTFLTILISVVSVVWVVCVIIPVAVVKWWNCINTLIANLRRSRVSGEDLGASCAAERRCFCR